MKTKTEFKNKSWKQFKIVSVVRTVLLLLCVVLANSAMFATVVTNCTEADLRAAMAGGGTVTFACDGTITLVSTIVIAKNTMLDATGHQVSISGGDLVRVFWIDTDITFTLINLTIAHGMGTNGGGIYNAGGTLNTTNCTFWGNSAKGPDGEPDGGIWKGAAGTNGCGGAIYNAGFLNASRCSYLQNTARGGSGAEGVPGHTGGGPPALPGGPGGPGGAAQGGAICNFGSMSIDRSLFASNTAYGGTGGRGGHGDVGTGLFHGSAGGPGAKGGNGYGGALFSGGTGSFTNCTFAWNQGHGGNGGGGGIGGIQFQGDIQFQDCCNIYFAGGSGGGGGPGSSGIYTIGGPLNIIHCTLALNSSNGGSGGIGGGGVPKGIDGANGVPSGGIVGIEALLKDSLLAMNTPGGNCSGTIIDAGHNLSSDASCMFTNFGSMNNTDPKLGPLADNGGPTLTMALLQGSPAIDAGDDTAAPPIDQRGFPRPFGLASDIGAYECGPPTITMPPLSQTAESGSTICLAVQASGDSILTYLWFCNGTNLISCGANGLLELTDVQFSHSGTYTVVVTNVFGAVTSAPVMLNVIAPIPRRPVPAIQLTGDLGSDLHVEYTDTLGLAANWLPLGTVTLTNTSQFSYDTTEPLPPQRFYCAWQSGTPVVVPSLQLPSFVLAITLTGDVGNKLRLDYINAIGPIDAWITLDTITLSNTAQLYFDVSAPGQPVRLYRIVPVP